MCYLPMGQPKDRAVHPQKPCKGTLILLYSCSLDLETGSKRRLGFMPQRIKPLHLTISLGNYLSVCSSVSERELEDMCVPPLR